MPSFANISRLDQRPYHVPVDDRAAKTAEFIRKNPDLIAYCHRQQNSFTANCLRKMTETGEMTGPQIAAIRRSLESNASTSNAPAERHAPPAAAGLDLRHIPEGRYAVPGDETRLKVLIQKPEAPSKWADWVFVSDGAEYGQQRKYGCQAPGKSYSGMIEKELRAIAADPRAAAIAYGKITGRCCLCGKKLETEASVAAGIGPTCAKKHKW